MTTSKFQSNEVFVWVWLPKHTEPVVAGVIQNQGSYYSFNYGKTYLARADAISLFEYELPLISGQQNPKPGLQLPGCLRDGSPDAWGRRVILHRFFGTKGKDLSDQNLDELTFMLESASDRVGALDFQTSPGTYKARVKETAQLEELLEAVTRVQQGLPLSPEISQALFHGTSLGGARPKAMLEDGKLKYIAKFAASNDHYSVVKAEFLAMILAKRVGLNVATVKWKSVAEKDVLLVERFDRTKSPSGWYRRSMVSALTLLRLDEMMARYASYEDLAEIVRKKFSSPKETLRELFSRIVFNILVGNNDDHARNHAAFWDGQSLSLTPAYDICPQSRSGNETSQAMLILKDERRSQMSLCLQAAPIFQLSAKQATELIEAQIETIKRDWNEACELCELSDAERTFFWKRQFLNPYCFENSPFSGVRY